MLCASLTSPVSGDHGPPLPAGKNTMAGRTPVPVADTPVALRWPVDLDERPFAKPMTERVASLSISLSEESATTPHKTTPGVCSAGPSTLANNSTCEWRSTLAALASGGLCSSEQVATLKKKYGSLKPLIPFLGKTFQGVDQLDFTDQEWHDVIKAWPLAIARVPAAKRCDSLYIQALCGSEGRPEVVGLLADAHKESLCYQAYLKNPALIKLLPVCERTPERCKMACLLKSDAIAHVPKDVQTEAFLKKVCGSNPDCFRHLSDDQKTKPLAMLVCKKRGELLNEVPPEQRDKELCEVACLSDSSTVLSVPEEICTEAFCEWLVDRSYMALEHIPTDKITLKMCESTCDRWPEGLEFVPERLKTESFCQKVSGHPLCFLAYPYLPARFVPVEKYRQPCEQSGGNVECVSDDLKDEGFYQVLTCEEFWFLDAIPEAARTRELCLKSGIGAKCPFVSVSDGHIDLAFLFSVMGGKDDLALHSRAQKLLKEEDYTTFLCISALYRTETQLKLLTWSGLPDRFRERLIDFLAGTGEPISLHNLPQHALSNPHNPLRFALYNPFVSKLLRQAHMANQYQPACQADGQAWLHYLEEQLPRYLDSPLPLITDAQRSPLQTGHIEAKGGRTLQVKEADTVYYYKFQRADEPLADLVREGLIHQFRAENPQGAWAKLASDLPTDPHFFALPKSMWPRTKEELNDEVKVHKESGREPCINVYRYTASADYGRYAHQPDRAAADCPFKKPEDAILTACYDMGLFASMGLMLTSMLPAMHNSIEKRSWQSLYDLFGYRHCVEVHPGTLGAWNGTATGHCDIGFNGLRDVGDYEQFGAIRSCFRKSGDDGTAQPQEIGQRLAVVSTLCDNVLAAILVRSRLRQWDADYHYSKSKVLAATACFINDVCDHLLGGLAGKSKSEVQPGITRKTMGFKKAEYDAWLQRTAFEIVYWSARQPGLNSANLAVLGQKTVDHDWQDGWISHLTKEKNLSDRLYDPVQFRPGPSGNSCPDSFLNPNHEDNLGGGNEVFPFTSLVQGLTSLGGDILAQGSTGADDTVMDNM